MNKWKLFEKNSANFLDSNVTRRDIFFRPVGESDSNACDINVYEKNNFLFSIECKFSPAQSSQFVVKLNQVEKKFVLSEDNRSNSDGTKEIIQHMNDQFDYYSASTTDDTNINLTCDESLMYGRVIKQLKKKSPLFVASSYESNFCETKPLVIDYIENIPSYFSISGKFRTKQSGTRNALEMHLTRIKDFKKLNDKFYIYDPSSNLGKYHPNDNAIFLQPPDNKGYRALRKRSTVRNANVIFSLVLKKGISHGRIQTLEKYISQILSK
jgi:hypothetical protein